MFDAEKFLASGTMQQMDDDVRDEIRAHGIRNAFADLDRSNGHDLSLCWERVVGDRTGLCLCLHAQGCCRKDGSRTEEEVVDYAVQMWRDKFGEKDVAGVFL